MLYKVDTSNIKHAVKPEASDYRITKNRLKRDAPNWKWFAERNGMGWNYVGRKGKRLVIVKAFSVMCGYVEDDYVTQWRVDDGKKTQNYVTWVLSHGV